MSAYSMVNASAYEFPYVADREKTLKFKSDLQCVMPGVVVDDTYDRQGHVVEVLPLTYHIASDGYHERPSVKCTLLRPFASNFLIDIPVKKGDTGWIVASDVGTDLVKEKCRPNDSTDDGHCGIVKADSANTHVYQYGFFIPDRWGKSLQDGTGDDDYQIDSDDLTNGRMVIQSANSKQRISIGQSDIKIVSVNSTDSTKSTVVTITDGVVTVETKTSVTVSCPTVSMKGVGSGETAVTIDGTLHVTGASTLDGNVTTAGDFVTGTTSYNNHVHTDSMSGKTGKPEASST